MSIPSLFANSASKERAIHQLRDLRLEFVSKFSFDFSFVTVSIQVLLVLRKLPSREAGSCILKSKACIFVLKSKACIFVINLDVILHEKLLPSLLLECIRVE